MTFTHKLSKRLAIGHWFLLVALGAGACHDDPTGTITSSLPTMSVTSFASGDRVKTSGTANIRSGSSASATLLGTQPPGALGTILAGPVIDSAGDKLLRWDIDFDSGVDGLVAEPYVGLILVAPASVTPVASGNATITATSDGKSGTATVTVTAASAPAAHAGYYVSPNGSSANDGSMSRPWTLSYALGTAGGRILAGDTVWVRGGTYRGGFRSTLTGLSGAPIVVRQYPGERGTVDAAGYTGDQFVVAGSWSVFWGLELMSSEPTRTFSTTANNARPNLLVNDGSHNKYINLVVHDGGVGFFNYSSRSDVEIYGSIWYNNGWQGPDRGHGHALYIKSDVGPVVARDNVIFNQYGYGIHVYTNTGSGLLNNIWIEGNVSFDNGSLSSSGTSANIGNLGQPPANDLTMLSNLTYMAPGVTGTYLTLVSGSGLRATGNYVVGGSGITQGTWTNATVTGNTVLAAGPASRQTAVFVRPNVYERGRATVTVYNWSQLGAVSVDLSGIVPVGARYEVRNVQDLYGAPVASGAFSGVVSIPLGGVTPPPPVGLTSSRSPRTGPYFDVFLVSILP